MANLEKTVKEIFGESAALIHFDKDSHLAITSKNDGADYMVHKVYYTEEKDKFILEEGSYLLSFESALIAYLRRKNISQTIEIPISEEDLSDLQNGEDFYWTFKSSVGMQINVVLKKEE